MARFHPAASADELLRRPIGRYWCEGHVLYWCASPLLTGVALWSAITTADFARLWSLFERGDHRRIAPDCDFVIDVRHVDFVDPEGFRRLERALAESREALVARTRRHALLRPEGLLGATALGAPVLLDAAVPTAAFRDLASAIAWLGRAEHAQHLREIDDLVSTVIASDGVLARLHAWFDASGLRTSLVATASALGLAPRSLQRSLGALSTSFRAELDAARLRAADELLQDPTAKLEAVAQRLGLRSGAHFSTWFRKHRQLSPSQFRLTRAAQRSALRAAGARP